MRLAVQLVGGAAVEFEIAGERDGVGAGLAQGLAVVAALQEGEFVRIAASTTDASFMSRRPRSVAVSLPQAPSKAARAALTAASMS